MNLRDKCRELILAGIGHDEEGRPLNTESEKVACLARRFEREKRFFLGNNVSRAAVADDWLRGMAIRVPFIKVEIMEIMEDCGIASHCDEDKYDRLIDRYYRMMGEELIKLIGGE